MRGEIDFRKFALAAIDAVLLERRAGWFTLRYDSIEAFKHSWPCHGLPDELHSISAEFAANGDLVDIECYADDGRALDSRDFDGPALVALVEDCQKFGDTDA